MRLILPLLLASFLGSSFQNRIAVGQVDTQDKKISKLMESLPPGWAIRVIPGTLILERKEQVWALWQNKVNAPPSLEKETDAERVARIKKTGRLQTMQIVFRMEPRWSAEKIAGTKKKNSLLDTKIVALLKKHRVEKLFEKDFPKGDEQAVYFHATQAERKRLDAYFFERKQLQAQEIDLPQYHTEKYSLFFERTEPDDGGVCCTEFYPAEASAEAFNIRSHLKDWLVEEAP